MIPATGFSRGSEGKKAYLKKEGGRKQMQQNINNW